MLISVAHKNALWLKTSETNTLEIKVNLQERIYYFTIHFYKTFYGLCFAFIPLLKWQCEWQLENVNLKRFSIGF